MFSSRRSVFDGKHVFVTGGANGMGWGTARELSMRGASVAIGDLRGEDFPARLAELRSISARPDSAIFTAHIVDVSKSESVVSVFAQVKHDHSSVHFVFNFAGRYGGTSCGKFSVDLHELRDVMEVNFFGTVSVCSVFYDEITSNNGSFINTASALGLFACPGVSCYSSSKHAVVGFTRSLKLDVQLQHPSSSVHVVCPGIVQTDILLRSERDGVFDMDQLDLSKRGMDPIAYKAPSVSKLSGYFKAASSTTPFEAGRQICDGVEAKKFTILVGNDASICELASRIAPDYFHDARLQIPFTSLITGLVKLIGRKTIVALFLIYMYRLNRRNIGY